MRLSASQSSLAMATPELEIAGNNRHHHHHHHHHHQQQLQQHNHPHPLPQQPPALAAQPVKRRRYARRSCLTCRSKKTRCELPDEAVPSSYDPLPVSKACHRCRALDIPCVVWDGNRKRKPRIDSVPSSSALSSSSSPSQPRNSHPLDRARASHGASPPPALDQADPGNLIARSSHRNAYPHPSDQNCCLANNWLIPSTSSQSPRRSNLYERPWHVSDAAPRIPPPYASPPSATRPSTTTTSSSNVTFHRSAAAAASAATDGEYDAALFINPKFSDSIKTKVAGGEIHILNNQCMHSPLVTLNRFITRIPSFSRLIRPEMDRSFNGQLSSLLTDENIGALESHLPRLRMWHPHVSDLESLRTAFHHRPNPSTSLLLATICLVASNIAGKRHLAKHFAVHIDRIGLHVLISAPKELHAAQAFELLLSHAPSLIGASVDPSGAAHNDSAVFGESLHSSAIAIAEAIGLDLVMSQALQDGFHPADHDDNSPQRLDKLRSYLGRFSLWSSLSMWRAKFLFLNSVVRPADFSRLRRDAELAISLVETLSRSDPQHAVPSKDEVLFRAGVLALAYRAIQVADFHLRLSQLETLWNSRPLFSDLEVRREVSSRVDDNLKFLAHFKNTKRRKLWAMANLAELKFLDRWIDLEFESDRVYLFQLYMRMVLPINKAAATVVDVSHSIDRDVGLFCFLFNVGERSYLNDERVLAGFAATPQFPGESFEQIGLPLLLTCGYILHISICIMEGVNFVYYGTHDSAIREDMFAFLLRRLAERICPPGQIESESLEKLVSSMLVQMARRLEEWEFYKVTQSPQQRTSTSTSQLPYAVSSNNDHQRPSGPPASASASERQPPSLADNCTRQGQATPVADVGAVRGDMPSMGWQDASDSGESPACKQGRNHLTHALPTPAHADISVVMSDSADAKAYAATSSSANADALLPCSDVWSPDNMARIMDEILSWNIMPDAHSANGNGAS